MSDRHHATVALSDDSHPLTKNRTKKRKRCCTIHRIAIAAVIILLTSGLSLQSFYLDYMATKKYDRLLADQTRKLNDQAKELAQLKEDRLNSLSEFDDAYTANDKLMRKIRHQRDENSNFHCVQDDKTLCHYSSRIGFFYTSHDTLEKTRKFTQEPIDRYRQGSCEEMWKHRTTGQIWCNNTAPRDDSFSNTFREIDLSQHSEVTYAYLTPSSGIMMKPGENWTDLSKHDFYNLDENKTIIIKKSGVYMIFSKVMFNITKGASISYSIRRNHGQVINDCKLIPRRTGENTGFEQCPTFQMVYLNKHEEITIAIAAYTHFLIGEKNFYVGLYQIMAFELPNNNTTIQTNQANNKA